MAMILKRVRELRALADRSKEVHPKKQAGGCLSETLDEIDRLRNALVRASHYAKQGNIGVVEEIVTSALFEPEEAFGKDLVNPESKARWATMADVEGLGVIEVSPKDWAAQAIRGESIPPFLRTGDISPDKPGRCLAVYFRDVEHLQEVLGIAHPVYLCVPDKPCTYPVKPGAIVALICRRLGKLED